MKLNIMPALFVLALIAGTVAPGVASADRGENLKVTFTKWGLGDTVGGPDEDIADMMGVVGGHVGRGTFFGEVFSKVDNGTTTTIHAVYHINGRKQTFIADNVITVTDVTGIAVITGVVTSGGPLHGATVHGGFRPLSTCDIPTPGNVNGNLCWKGTLKVTR